MPMSADAKQELRVLTAGAEEVLPADALAERLQAARAEGRPLRVKLGIDPSSPHLTLGHAVVLRKLAQFQRFGHTVVLIIGNFTGLVGDPSGRSQTRRRQTEEEVAGHIRTYLDQVGKVLDVGAAEIRYNAEWLAPMTFAQVADLASSVTVAQLLEREDFRNRYASGQPISLVEFLYPLLRGVDGVQKMSKSLNNGVYLDDPPEEQFGKLMSIPDHLVPEYLRLCTDLDPDEISKLIEAAGQRGVQARDVKRRLAREVTELYHGAREAAAAEAAFDAGVAARRGVAEVAGAIDLDVPPGAVGEDGRVGVVALLAEAGLAPSRGAARRLVSQGAVRLDGVQISTIEQAWPLAELEGRLLTVGRRATHRLRVADR